MRRGCLVAIGVSVALAVMAAGVLLFVNVPRLFPRLTGNRELRDWVKDNLNAELEAGYIAPLVYPGLGIQIRGLDIKLNDPEGKPRDFFSADAIKIVADRKELFHNRRVVVRKILVEGPRITVVREPSGKWALSDWAKKIPRPEKKEPEEEGLIRWLIKDSLKKALPRAGTGLKDLLAVSSIEIEDAELNMMDHGSGKKILLDDVDLKDIAFKFIGATADAPASFEISFPFPQGEGYTPGPLLRFEGKIKADSDTSLSFPSITGGWSDIHINNLSGSIELKPAFKFDANLDANALFPAVKRAAMWRPIARSKTLPDMEGQGGGRVRAHVWGPEKSRAAKVHYTGTVEVDDMTWYPGRVLAPLEHLTTTIYLEDGVVRMPETEVTVGGARIVGSGRMTESKTPRFDIDASTGNIDFARFFQPRHTPYKKGQQMHKMKTFWGGHAIIGKGVYGKMSFTDAVGSWDVTNQRLLTFPELRFNACGGSYLESGRSWVDFNDPTDYRFRFDGSMRRVDVTSFVDQVFDTTTFLHGAIDADGFVTGKFADGDFVTRSMAGELKITVRDGYFEGFNLVGNLLGVFGLPLPEDLKGQRFNVMSATTRIDRAVAYFDDLTVEAPGLGAEARGWIDFASQHADLKITLHPGGTLAGLVAMTPIIGPTGKAMTTLYVRAYGHFDYLKYETWNPLEDKPSIPPGIENNGGE